LPTMENEKLYIVVRADLPPGDRAAQSCHAAFAFAMRHPTEAGRWFWDSNNIVLLECADEAALRGLVVRARLAEVPYALFSEPDFDCHATACAFSTGARRFLSSLPLALKEPKRAA
jgi:peptidyl-tRNA hydrolase